MKFGSKFKTFAFITFLLLVILYCCFSNNSNIIEGLDPPPCNMYIGESDQCPSDRCTLKPAGRVNGSRMPKFKCVPRFNAISIYGIKKPVTKRLTGDKKSPLLGG